MAKPDTKFLEKQTWGTWEELLLACAVHRYGTDSWDSVAMEVQKRSSSLNVLTPHSCQQKYNDLKRRFTQNDAVSESEGRSKSKTIPWLDELRKLRVDELKREVERYDLSIVSLQLKVKRLKEESLGENEKETEKSDLDKIVERDENEDKDDKVSETENEAGKSVSGEELNRSVNESNSTDPKEESPGTGTEEADKEQEPVEPELKESNRNSEEGKPEDYSCNGSCDSVAKESAGKSERVDPGESTELWESAAESKREREGEEGNNMESSDVQSSVSLSRKQEKPENEEDQSPAIKRRVSVESQPLVDFLEILRSHKFGSLFERRLMSQETTNDIDVIRQHIDLEIIGTRLEEGWYSGCNKKFFRDLLLVFNNAIVFYGKKSSESMAAIDLRQLVSKEVPLKTPKPSLLQKVQSAMPPGPPTLKPDSEPSHSLAVKPKMSVPLVACRKRSSITAKSSGTSSGADKKRERTALLDEKPDLDLKQQEKSFDKAEEQCVTKKRTSERSTSGARKTNKNSRSRATTNTNRNTYVNLNNGVSSKGMTNNDNSESKAEKEKKNNPNASAKKQSAAKFLNRMKRSSSSNNGSLLETLKGSVISPDNGKGEGSEEKKNGNSKGDSRKDQISRKRSGGNRGKERESPTKRSIGRPPKRAAAPAPLTSVIPAKRGREAGETEAGSSRHAKKRSRK